MTEEYHKKFTTLKETGALLDPEVPATVISNLALHGKGDNINGKSFRYSDDGLAAFAKKI